MRFATWVSRAGAAGLGVAVVACGSTGASPSGASDGGRDAGRASDASNQEGGVTSDASIQDGSVTPDAASCAIPPGASPSQIIAVYQSCYGVSVGVVDARAHRELDVLVLVDNSPSMATKQQALAASIGSLFQAIEATGANYHVGVATSDVGTWTAPNSPWPVSLGACDSYAGDDGALQSIACTLRGGSSDAQTACQAACPDPSFVPTDAYIARTDGVSNVPVNMVGGVDVGPATAFGCIGVVSDIGCGVEGQFEGVKRALDGHNASNSGFLRPSSVLAVVMITDEDDCSVALAQRDQNTPVTTDCAAPDPNAAFGCFNHDYRCMATDVTCAEPLNTAGAKTNCSERATTYLNPTSTYASFLLGLRPASRMFLGGVWAPDVASGGAFNVAYLGTGTTSDALNRDVGANAACVSAGNANLWARPQVRLSELASEVPGATEANICNDSAYGTVLSAMGTAMKTRLDVGCTSGVPREDSGGAAMCVVGDVPASSPTTAPATAFPACGASCCAAWGSSTYPTPTAPAIASACAGEAATPCYCAVASSQPGVCSGAWVAGVWRSGGAAAPDGTVATFECAR